MASILNNYISLITGIFSLFIFIKSGFSIFSSRNFERQFFSKEKKFVYEILNLTLFFIVFPTLLCFALYTDNSKIIKLIYNYFGYFGTFFIITSGIILYKKAAVLFKKKYLKLINRNSILRFLLLKKKITNNKLNNTLLLIIGLIFFTSTWVVFGALNTDILNLNIHWAYRLLVLASFMLLELYIIYVLIVWALDFKLTTPVLVSIKMDCGQEYKNYYIYNPSHQKYLLIGNTSTYEMCDEPILINVDKITSCTKVHGQFL